METTCSGYAHISPASNRTIFKRWRQKANKVSGSSTANSGISPSLANFHIFIFEFLRRRGILRRLEAPRNRQMLLDRRIFLRSLYFHENTGYNESFKFYEIVCSMSLSSSSKVATFLQKRRTSRTLRISPNSWTSKYPEVGEFVKIFRVPPHTGSHRNFAKSPTFSKLLAIGEFSQITRFFPQQENFPRSLFLREIARYFSVTVIFQHRHRLLLFESREFVIAKLEGTAGRDETDGKERRRVPSRTCRRTIENKRSVQGWEWMAPRAYQPRGLYLESYIGIGGKNEAAESASRRFTPMPMNPLTCNKSPAN